MSKKRETEPETETAPGGQPAPTSVYEEAMAAIKAEAAKLVAAGMGGHDAHKLAFDVYVTTRTA